jgi:ADA HAT complex component 1
MLSLLRWGLGSGHDDHLTEKVRIQEEERCRPQVLSTMNPSTTIGTVKRKRGKSTLSNSSTSQRPAKRHPQFQNHVQPSLDNSTRNLSSAVCNATLPVSASLQMDCEEKASAQNQVIPETSTDTNRINRLRELIENEFNLEILLKHNELRFIDQEIAKVQVALEQLRRCSVIPYPAMSTNPLDMLNVGSGTGISRPIQPGLIPPDNPPPWGVVDGPYTRHYARWLLPDPTFDGALPEPMRYTGRGGKTIPERQTRGGKAEKSALLPKGRQRGLHSRLQALPAGYPEHKEPKGPMILKRASDGKLVKLVCPNCHREDFNSAQGFINHCRIAHGHNLASHEAAARECGQEIDPNEVGSTVPESAVPQSAQPVSASVGLVHPFVRSGPMPPVPTLSMPIPKRSQPVTPQPKTVPNENFKASPQLPHLSRLFSKLNKGVDLQSAIEDATKKEVIDVPSDSEVQDSEVELDSAISNAMPMARVPSRISTRGGPSHTTDASRPKSRKGPDRVATRRPEPFILGNSTSINPSISHASTQFTLPDVMNSNDLSPHTVESNNAPSLVSDDDDDEYASEANESSSPSSTDDAAEDVVNVGLDLRGGFGADASENEASSSADPELRASSKARPHANANVTENRERHLGGAPRGNKRGVRGRRKPGK